MTRPKGEAPRSEARPYAYSTNSSKRKSGCLPADEIADLFVRVGWLGRRRQNLPQLTDHRGRPITYWGGLASGR